MRVNLLDYFCSFKCGKCKNADGCWDHKYAGLIYGDKECFRRKRRQT